MSIEWHPRLLNLAVKDADISFENVVFEYVEGKRILNELSIQVGEWILYYCRESEVVQLPTQPSPTCSTI